MRTSSAGSFLYSFWQAAVTDILDLTVARAPPRLRPSVRERDASRTQTTSGGWRQGRRRRTTVDGGGALAGEGEKREDGDGELDLLW
jgi:hypothetical protein